MKFFQDLSQEQKDAIIKGLKKDLRQEMLEMGYKNIDEYVDDYINRNNNPEQISEWLEIYWIEL